MCCYSCDNIVPWKFIGYYSDYFLHLAHYGQIQQMKFYFFYFLFFYFFSENRQIVSLFFCKKKKEKIFQNVIC